MITVWKHFLSVFYDVKSIFSGVIEIFNATLLMRIITVVAFRCQLSKTPIGAPAAGSILITTAGATAGCLFAVLP